jgi:hypothetical protein
MVLVAVIYKNKVEAQFIPRPLATSDIRFSKGQDGALKRDILTPYLIIFLCLRMEGFRHLASSRIDLRQIA